MTEPRSTPQSSISLESLFSLAEQGFHLFPVHGIFNGLCTCGDAHSADSSAGKHPVTSRGMNDATIQPELLNSWYQQFAGHNWAAALAPSGLCVVDIDPRNGGHESWERFEALLPTAIGKTVAAQTGLQSVDGRQVRGMHLYFQVDQDIQLKGTLGKDAPGVDVKRNGYVLLPGSLHASGVFYGWLEGCSPMEVEPRSLPAEILELLQVKGRSGSSAGVPLETLESLSQDITPYGQAALKSESRKVLDLRSGERNSGLFESGLRIGSLVAGGQIPLEAAVLGLVDAAVKTGLSDEEAVQTLIRPSGTGALQIGASTPRVPKQMGAAHKLQDTLTSDQVYARGAGEYLNIVDWSDAFMDTSEEEWLVPGFICEGRSHLIYAEAGLGKSLLVLDLSAALASGKSALGQSVRDPISVLYLDHENTVKGDVIPRLRQMGYTPAELGRLTYASFPQMAPLDTSSGGQMLSDAIDLVNPDLVVIDTVSRTISGDENSNSTWLEFYTHAGKLLKSKGIAYIRVDHVGKNLEAGPRGGSAKKGDVDLVWNMTLKTKPNRFKLTCEKSRVPISTSVLEVLRSTDPVLAHELRFGSSAIDFAELSAQNARFELALELVKADELTQGKLMGQKAVWGRVMRSATKSGISHDLFVKAHKAVKYENASSSEDWD